LSVESLTEFDAAITQYFTKPEVQHIGLNVSMWMRVPALRLQGVREMRHIHFDASGLWADATLEGDDKHEIAVTVFIYSSST
jgi:hypothetical protein